MEQQQKIQYINNLNERIRCLTDFIQVAKNGNKITEYKDKDKKPLQNYFSEMHIESEVWTGTDTCRKCVRLSNGEDIAVIAECVVVVAEQRLEALKSELTSLLK